MPPLKNTTTTTPPPPHTHIHTHKKNNNNPATEILRQQQLLADASDKDLVQLSVFAPYFSLVFTLLSVCPKLAALNFNRGLSPCLEKFRASQASSYLHLRRPTPPSNHCLCFVSFLFVSTASFVSFVSRGFFVLLLVLFLETTCRSCLRRSIRLHRQRPSQMTLEKWYVARS